ncbi:extracellular solute-binding protein [Aurantivibrio plasticivorans]
MKRKLILACFSVTALLLFGCSSEDNEQTNKSLVEESELKIYPVSELPEGIIWETNNEDPVFSSPDAKKGGTLNSAMASFPLTLRWVGPDSNSGFRSLVLGNQVGLIDFHPNTHNVIPAMATHWAYGKDGKTIYYKLDPRAEWSDGKPVTADDYLFTLDFMRSEHIVAPWYNDHYTNQILNAKKYDDYTISITGAVARPKIDLHYYYSFNPTARHFHKLDENWVKDYNWKIEPNTGPYQISKIDKGKSVVFERKKDWWAKDLRYYKNRFNVDKVSVKVIRDPETTYRHFLRGEIDAFGLTLPSYWHDKAKSAEFENGYIHKIWFYNELPQPSQGFYLNQDDPTLSDKNVRYGIAHALNIEKMLKTVLRGDYERLHSGTVGYGDYSNSDLKARAFDLDMAESYFSKAGWDERGPDGIRVKDGTKLSFTVTYSSDTHSNRLVFLKEEAKKAGLELVLELLDGSTAFKKILEKKHQIAWMAWSTGLRPQFWGGYHSANAHAPQTNNITNTDDPELDALIDTYRIAEKKDDAVKAAHAIQEKIHEHGAFIPAYMVPYVRQGYWRWMKLPQTPGTKWSDTLFDFTAVNSNLGTIGGLFWIDEEVKQETLDAMKTGKTFEPVTIIDETYRVQ